MAKIPNRAIVGMLSYIMGHTKPDIAYALNVLSRRTVTTQDDVTSSSFCVWLSTVSIARMIG